MKKLGPHNVNGNAHIHHRTASRQKRGGGGCLFPLQLTRSCLVATLLVLTTLCLSLSYWTMVHVLHAPIEHPARTDAVVSGRDLMSSGREKEELQPRSHATSQNVATGSGKTSNSIPKTSRRVIDTEHHHHPANVSARSHQAWYRFPKGCELFRKHLEDRVFSSKNVLTEEERQRLQQGNQKKGRKGKKNKNKTQEEEEDDSGFKVLWVKRLTRHVLVLDIPDCGRYVMKLSCRPPISFWLGRQAWPEIVANILDQDVLGYNLTLPAYGMVLPLSMISNKRMAMLSTKCVFPFEREKVLVGSLTPFANFSSHAKRWYNRECDSGSTRFLDQLFRLNVLDYLVLNTDRHMSQNWFHDPEGNILAMDNGAWSFHNHSFVCDAQEYHESMFEVVRVLKSKPSNCTWIKNTTQPVCTLTSRIRNSPNVRSFLSASSNIWRKRLELVLQRDLWFRWAPSIFSTNAETFGEEMLEHILARDMSSCGKNIRIAGITKNKTVTPEQLHRFLSVDLANRFTLAQQTIRNCLASS